MVHGVWGSCRYKQAILHGGLIVGLLIAGLSANFAVHAQASKSTLFAVDVSLNAQERSAAFDLIGETILDIPQDHSLGLTLFDDTVRSFVANALPSVAQIKALDQALTEAPDSVRTTSNLAVGIERAIDDPVPPGGADLVVFSRGVIDTPSQDPRARFDEWLEKILLHQALQKQVVITLVLPKDATADPALTAAFEKSLPHQIVFWREDNKAAVELIRMLGVNDREFGSSAYTELTPAEVPQAEAASLISSIEVAESTAPPVRSAWHIVRLIFLMIALILLIGSLYWWYRTQRNAMVSEQITHQSSTYLPLSAKPGGTMGRWNTGSQSSTVRPFSPASNMSATIRMPGGKSANAQSVATESEKDLCDD